MKHNKLQKGLLCLFLMTFLSRFSVLAVTITAAGSGNWSSTGTWTGGSLPTSSDDVVIAGGYTVTVDNNLAACKTLQLGQNGSGDGTLTFNSSTFLGAAGNVTLGNGTAAGSINMASLCTLQCPMIIVSGTGTNTWSPDGTVQLTGTGTLPSTVFTTYKSLNLIPGAGNTISLGTNTSITGTLLLGNGTFAIADKTLTLGVNTLIDVRDGVISKTTGGISSPGGGYAVSYMPQNADYTTGLELNGTDFKDVTIDGGSYTVTLNSAMTVGSGYYLNLKNTTFITGTNLTMAAGSQIHRTGGAMTGTIQGSNAYLISYDGSSVTSGAELSGSGAKSVTTNFSSGTQVLTLGASLTIEGTLTMSFGDINLNGKTLSLGSSTSAPGNISYSSGGIVLNSGTLKRWYDNVTTIGTYTAGIFPIKIGSYNRSIMLKGTPGSGGTLTVSAVDVNATTTFGSSFTESGITFTHRNNSSWTVTAGDGFTGSMDVQIYGEGISGVIDATKLTISGSAGALSSGIYAASSGTTSFPVLERTLVTMGGTFYIAGSGISPLPVSLVRFYAEKSSERQLLRWVTESETNNAGFDVERSVDMLNWESIGWVQGHGTTQARNSYDYSLDNIPGTVYFRLKQVDYNGSFEYSSVVSVKESIIDEAVKPISVYPLPAKSRINVGGITGPVSIIIYDLKGNEVFKTFETYADISGLSTGCYVMNVRTTTESYSKLLIKE